MQGSRRRVWPPPLEERKKLERPTRVFVLRLGGGEGLGAHSLREGRVQQRGVEKERARFRSTTAMDRVTLWSNNMERDSYE